MKFSWKIEFSKCKLFFFTNLILLLRFRQIFPIISMAFDVKCLFLGNLKRLNSSTAICIAANGVFGANRTMLHLCCNGYAKHETLVHLEQARRWGIKSILALGGDQEEPNMPMEKQHYAIDLVKWARQFQPKKNGCVNVNGGVCEELTLGIAGHIQPPLKEVSYGQYLLHLRHVNYLKHSFHSDVSSVK